MLYLINGLQIGYLAVYACEVLLNDVGELGDLDRPVVEEGALARELCQTF